MTNKYNDFGYRVGLIAFACGVAFFTKMFIDAVGDKTDIWSGLIIGIFGTLSVMGFLVCYKVLFDKH